MHATLILLAALTVGETQDHARAKAVLTLAAAAVQAKPVPQVPVFWEHLIVMPAEVAEEARPPKPKLDLSRLTLEEGAALAAKGKLPMLVWVGNYDDTELRARLPKCVQVRVETWKGSADKGVVACPLHGGGPLGLLNPSWPVARRLIPAKEASVNTVLRELSGSWLREPQKQATTEARTRTIREVPVFQICEELSGRRG